MHLARPTLLIASLCALLTPSLPSSRASAQATCVDAMGDACLNALTALRGPDAVVDDIFQTSDGRYAPQLTFGTYLRGANGCAGWTGWAASPADPAAPGAHEPIRRTFLDQYICNNGRPHDEVARYADSLDWYWTQVLRTNAAGAAVPDGASGDYEPSRGRIYDLGGEANRVVVFPISDHGPLPCESFEYTIWLSNNPDAIEIAPESAPDPNKWNLARLVRVFRQGWTRNPYAEGAADRDRPDLGTFLRDASGTSGAEADSLVTVWALACGLSFRYAAMQAGNNGNPDPACTFHSQDDELDAVAGLNEDDTAICVDADGDGHRDAACGGSDCDDANPSRHPGAFERCDATEDLDCAEMRACPAGTICQSASGLCVTQCFEGGCATGLSCVDGACVESACALRPEPCPSGTLCREGECVAPCDGVVCPAGERCTGGACIDPCEGVLCPTNQVCVARDPSALTLCGPSCNCTELAAPLCPTGAACDVRADSETAGRCVDPGCETATCGPGEVCTAGTCVDGCAGVMCPRAQICIDGACVTDRCASVVCPGTQVCRDGECFDACVGVSCGTGQICRDGACIADSCFGVACSEGQRCVAGTCIADGTIDAGGMRRDAGGQRDAGRGTVTDGACGCRAVGVSSSAPLGLFALALLLVARRRAR